MRRLISLAILALLGFYVAWPAYSLYRIRGALDSQDGQVLASKIDFPSVRESLKPYAAAEMEKAISKVEGGGGVLGQQFKDQLQTKAVDALLQSLVTPENFIKAYAERKSLKELLSAKSATNPAVAGAAIDKLSEKTGVDVGKVIGGLFGKKPQEGAQAPQPAPTPAPAPAPAPTAAGEPGAKPGYSLQNVKGFGPLGPLGFWVGIARDKAAATAELIAEMRFTGGDWKITGLKPQT